jgi:hypothetical protein
VGGGGGPAPMAATTRSRTVITTALLVVGSLGALVGVGAPVTADEPDTSSTTTSTTTTSTTTTTAVPPSTETSTTTTSVESTTTPEATTAPSVIPPEVAAPAASQPGGVTIDAGASVAPAVPIGAPAQATGVTPSRGTQVQLRTPPPPPPADWELPANSGTGRRAVYSKSAQRVWAVDENEVVIKTHRVSGRLDPLDPAPGVYSVYSRSLHTYAIHNPSITWSYMVRFARGNRGGNIGFHEIPFQYGQPVQSIDQLGDPLSGGCVRQATPDAIWMWEWAQVGTVVVVLA